MFKQLFVRIESFAKERDWEKFHHPKNLILNTFVELSEMVEHLIAPQDQTFEELKRDQEKFPKLCEELGDLIINLSHLAKQTGIPMHDCKPAQLSLDLSPSQLVHRLFVTLGFFAEPLTWIEEKESLSFKTTEEMPAILQEAVSITLCFANRLGVCPVETALSKMDKIEKKYPKNTVVADVVERHRKKAKERNSYD